MRISPASWDEPELDDWLEAITRVTTPDSVLVAHSLGCLAVANWLVRGGTARSIAATWRVPIEFVGDAGHINAAAGVGDWPQGHKLLRALVSAT